MLIRITQMEKNPVGKHLLARKSIWLKVRKVVKIKVLLLVGKNLVGNNILGKTLSTSFIWSSFFSVFFVSYLFIVLNISQGKKKLHIILIFTVQYAWRKHSAPPFTVVISWKCMPPYHFFSPKPSRKPRKKKRHEQFVMLQPPFPSFFYFPGGFFFSVLIG